MLGWKNTFKLCQKFSSSCTNQSFKDPLVITVALTGNVPTKEMNPNLPCTSEEIVEDSIKCLNGGASVFHIHARDPITLRPTHDVNIFKKTCALFKKSSAKDGIIQLSTGMRAGKSHVERMNVVRLLPEMASFTTGSNNLAKLVYENPPYFLNQLAKAFMDTGVKPEVECFDSGHLTSALYFSKKGKIRTPIQFNFVLNTVGGASGSLRTLLFMADQIPQNCTWSVSGIGDAQMRLAAAAIAHGGHVRIGLEDNIRMPNGSLGTNLKMVETVVRLAKEMGRKIATPDEARKLLSLDPKQKDRILRHLGPDSSLAPVDLSLYPTPKE